MAATATDTVRWHSAERRLNIVREEARKREELNNESKPSFCPFCLALLRVINAAQPQKQEILFDVSRIDHDCQNHAAILTLPLSEPQIQLTRSTGQRAVHIRPDCNRVAQGSPSFGLPWEPFVSEYKGNSVDFELDDRPRCQPRLVNRQWIDIALLKDWLTRCINDHGSECGQPRLDAKESMSLSAFFLIDTEAKCLVPMLSSYKYVTLSYVWGGVKSFVTTKNNVTQLCKPGAIDQVRLPKTIKQAIALTSALGQRYIWIDALCIIQDAPGRHDPFNAMADIYAKSTLTIVAAQGDHSDHGFRGLSGISDARCTNQKVAALSARQHLVLPSSKHVWDDRLLRPWSARAWTFQESILSRRLLYFAHDSVRWSCEKSQWSEEFSAGRHIQTYSISGQSQIKLPSHNLPILYEYQSLVNSYNVRKLTYSGDALIAFAGVATRLSDNFRGGLISGIPEMFFDMCLLWRPSGTSGRALRRRPNSTSDHVDLPTWSWAAWETEVSWPFTWNVTSNPADAMPIMLGGKQPRYRIRPTYTSVYDDRVTAIQACWFDVNDNFEDEVSYPDWSRNTTKVEMTQEWGLPPATKASFKHDSDSSIEFCYPFQLSTSPIPARIVSRIEFDTTHGDFKLGAVRNSISQILTIDGRPAGTLWHHDSEDVDFIHATTEPLEERTSIELIAILCCHTPVGQNSMWTMSDVSVVPQLNAVTALQKTEELYNVMWIVRDQDDIAYRKATGVVKRDIWEMEASEWVNIVLG